MLQASGSSCVKSKLCLIITLLAFVGAGFYCRPLMAEDGRESKEKKGKIASSKKKTEAKSGSEQEAIEDRDMFLKEEAANARFLPDIYRCSECGYEQDEPGFCPDHNEIELVQVLARGRDPIEPGELDGNEDILVDVPLKNLEFRKEAALGNASETQDSGKISPKSK